MREKFKSKLCFGLGTTIRSENFWLSLCALKHGHANLENCNFFFLLRVLLKLDLSH